MYRQIDLLANDVHITPDGGERVAHFMRHACHHFTQRGESLRLRQTALRCLRAVNQNITSAPINSPSAL